jgi:hypothetical protein
MRYLISLFFLVLGVSSVNFSFAGNGSSGVGSVPIGSVIDSRINDYKNVVKRGDSLVDLKTGEKLLKIEQVDPSELKKYPGHLVHSDLGSVKGYEYLPNKDAVSHQDNFWIVCPDGQSCLKLTPKSDSNPRVMDIIGGLQKKGE